MTYRRGRKPQRDPRDPTALAKTLPIPLRTFDRWIRPGGGPAPGLGEYQSALRQHLVEKIGADLVDDELLYSVQKCGPGPASVWWQQVFGVKKAVR